MTGISVLKHTQAVPSTTWVINHNLGRQPLVDVYIDYNGSVQKVSPLSIVHTTDNQLTITFSTARTGGATLV